MNTKIVQIKILYDNEFTKKLASYRETGLL